MATAPAGAVFERAAAGFEPRLHRRDNRRRHNGRLRATRRDDQICQLRIYMPMSALIEQLTI